MNKQLLQFIKNKKSGKALDLGAGGFSDVFGMIKKNWQTFGVDKLMGIDLNKPYLDWNAPYDLIYSNYVLQQIKNKKIFVKTIYSNLKPDGIIFIQTFDITDPMIKRGRGFTQEELLSLFSPYFKDIKIKKFSEIDDDSHNHIILELTAIKKDSNKVYEK